jgi:hypothetical protein
VHAAALKGTDVDARTLFSALGLRLLAVSWPWALAFKLARYAKDDPADARAIVRLLYWRYEQKYADARTLEAWVVRECAAMGYAGWAEERRSEMRARLWDAVRRAQETAR